MQLGRSRLALLALAVAAAPVACTDDAPPGAASGDAGPGDGPTGPTGDAGTTDAGSGEDGATARDGGADAADGKGPDAGRDGGVGGDGGDGGTQSYTTTFDGAENPLSENGVWSHLGLDWAVVAKSGGIAFTTQTGAGGYDDAYALLSGFLPTQTGSAVVQISPTIDRSCTHEVEILLRWTDSAHSAKGYECNLSFDGGYSQIVRWNGALGDFTPLAGGSAPGLKSGDTFKATIQGSLITTYVNDVKIVEFSDPTYATGNPGVGFFRRQCGTGQDFAFTSFSATGGP